MSGWPLKMRRNDENWPFVGKFTDVVEFESAKPPIKMYAKDEEIREDEDLNVVKDSEYWKNKKKKRFGYRKKSQVILEDSTVRPPNSLAGLRFEGRPMLNNSVEAADSKNTADSKDPLMKHVLLQVVRTEVMNEATGVPTINTEVNVIPVGGWYQFRKPSLMGQKLLDEIDEDYEVHQARKKKEHERYKRILHVLKESDQQASNGGSGGRGDDDGRGGGGGGGGTIDAPLGLFGAAVNKALKSKKGLKRNAPVRHLDDGGVDVDEVQAYSEYCKGDYEANRADDEDDVGQEQIVLEDREETEAGQVLYEEESDPGADTEDEDDDDDEDGDDDRSAEDGPRSGLVDEHMEESARELQKIVAGTQGTAAVDGTARGVGGVGKRDRDYEQGGGDSGAAGGGAGGGGADASRQAKKPRIVGAGSTGTGTGGRESRGAGADEETGEYELSDDGVRAYITNVGGLVPITDLKEVFKKQCKAHEKTSGQKKSGINRLKDIVLRITKNVDDPLMGTVLALK